ncbi:SGNH/GDSL hydrolase family protein [Kitasatospora sp. NPDC056184]|uniref:SGNH/GDSL hydrolase family protein n=1 Tax=Kitasatospora sp. NPDC056184 TaxID=3345738 RepID=UPI0035E13BC3
MRAWNPPVAGSLRGPVVAVVAAVASLVVALAGVLASPASAASSSTVSSVGERAGGAGTWTGAWGSGLVRPTAPQPWSWPNWAWEGFADQSLRQVVRSGAEGSQLRVRLSNQYGHGPLRLTRATVARAAEGASALPGTVRELRFSGRAEAVVPTGEDLLSDALRLPVRPLERLAVTLYFAGATGPVGFHEDGLATAYRAAGDRTQDTAGDAFGGATSESHYLLAGVEVRGARTEGGVVAFGDSLTDGWGSTPGTDRRYPDRLAERLLADGRRLAVVNAGISGNQLLTDSPCYGDRALDRFRRDVLDRPGVRTAVVLIGINDIGASGLPDWGCGSTLAVTAGQVIEGHRALIRAAHRRGVTVIGATLTPFRGYAAYHSPQKERVRDAVNRWIRTSGAYDAVADLDRVLADPRPGHRTELAPAYDSGDGLHPNDAGTAAMAEAVADLVP